MNKLDLLIEERDDYLKSITCLQESIKHLNIMRDIDLYQNLEIQKKSMSKHLEMIEQEIEKTKESFNAIIVTQNESGVILTAKNKENKDVFLRIAFLPERKKAKNLNEAFLFDWVDKIEDDCFIIYSNYSVTKEQFKTIYSYHKKNNKIENDILPKTLNLREVEREIKNNYIFKEK